MTSMVSLSVIFFSSLTLLSIASAAEERAPHGLARENPMAFPPSAYKFFHPTNQNPIAKDPCKASNCSPLMPLAAQVQATEAHESKVSASQNGRTRLGVGGIAGIVFGLAFAAFVAMGVYRVLVSRREDMRKANTVKPDA